VAALWAGYRVYERAQLSPFILGDVRAGMLFSTVENDAKAERGPVFTCNPLGNQVRLCKLVSDGPIGVLKIVVDRSGRAAVIQFLVSDTSQRWIEKAREVGAEWSLVHQSRPAQSELTASVTRWETDNHRWSAQLSRRRETNFPFEMLVTDANRLGRIADANPSMLMRLANEGMVGRDDLAAAEKYASGAMAKASDSLSAAGAVLARKASGIPRCPPAQGAEIVEGNDLRSGMGVELAAVAEQLVARMYPGSKLVIGNRKMYLVDSQGAAEEIGLHPNTESVSDDLYAFAVTFPERAVAANDEAKAFKTDIQCRAVGEVVVAHLDRASRAVAELQRMDVDEESLMSVVGTLDFVPARSGHPAFEAGYLATYGGSQWSGQLHWIALIALDPLTVLLRVPTSYEKSDADGVMTGGALIAGGERDNDPYGPSIKPSATTRVSVMDLSNPAAPARHAVLLAGPSGLASGWTLLSQL
jgi:hypothetical protein